MYRAGMPDIFLSGFRGWLRKIMKGEIEMNEWEKLTKEAERYKKEYPPGTRIELQNMADPLAPVPSGTRGSVELVDDIGQIHMHWDNGRSLALVPQEDSFRKLTAEELAEEQMPVKQTAEGMHTMEM